MDYQSLHIVIEKKTFSYELCFKFTDVKDDCIWTGFSLDVDLSEYFQLSDEVYKALKCVISGRKMPKVEQMIDGVSGFLFLDDRGEPMLAYQWEKKFQRSVEKYNKIYRVELPKVTPHICRYIYCTNMAKSGIDIKTLQYLMGHSDISVTINVYTHLKLADAKDELEKLKVREGREKTLNI